MTLPFRVNRLSAPARSRRGIRLAALRVPLAAKLSGANLFVVAVLVAAWLLAGGTISGVVMGIVAVVLVLHAVLVVVALRPIRDLETLAERVWHGDYGARVARSPVADDEVLRIGSMFNILLDGMSSDRTQMRALAADVVAAGDRERAALARELHDSTAQHVAALLLELASVARDVHDPVLAARLGAARDVAAAILEEVRTLSESVHSAVLDDLGLAAALRKLARDASAGTGIDVDVNADAASARLPRDAERVLYHVAQEAVRNAALHAAPRRIHLTLSPRAPATLEVHDDGRGFDLAAAEGRSAGRGLASMRERLALLDGQLDVRTAPGGGTTIVATIPVSAAPDTVH